MTPTNQKNVVVAFQDKIPAIAGRAVRLGGTDRFSWYAVPCDIFISAGNEISETCHLVYLDLDSYRKDVERLTEQQKLEAVLHRIARPELFLNIAAGRLGEQFAFIAVYLQANGPPQPGGATWEKHCSKAFETHWRCYSIGRRIEPEYDQIAMLIGQRRTMLTVEQSLSADKNCSADDLEAVKKGIAAYPATYKLLAETAAAFGRPAYTKAPAIDHSERAVAVEPDNPSVQGLMKIRELSGERFGDKILLPLSLTDIASLKIGAPPVVVFTTMTDYSEAKTELTGAQLHNVVSGRLTTGGMTSEDRLQWLIENRGTFIARSNALLHAARKRTMRQCEPLAVISSGEARCLYELSGLHGYGTAGRISAAVKELSAQLTVLRFFCRRLNVDEYGDWFEMAAATLAALAAPETGTTEEK